MTDPNTPKYTTDQLAELAGLLGADNYGGGSKSALLSAASAANIRDEADTTGLTLRQWEIVLRPEYQLSKELSEARGQIIANAVRAAE